METKKQSGYRVICKDLTISKDAEDSDDKKGKKRKGPKVRTKTFTVYLDPGKNISFDQFVKEMEKRANQL